MSEISPKIFYGSTSISKEKKLVLVFSSTPNSNKTTSKCRSNRISSSSVQSSNNKLNVEKCKKAHDKTKISSKSLSSVYALRSKKNAPAILSNTNNIPRKKMSSRSTVSQTTTFENFPKHLFKESFCASTSPSESISCCNLKINKDLSKQVTSNEISYSSDNLPEPACALASSTLNSRKIRKEDPSENLINSQTLSSAYALRSKKNAPAILSNTSNIPRKKMSSRSTVSQTTTFENFPKHLFKESFCASTSPSESISCCNLKINKDLSKQVTSNEISYSSDNLPEPACALASSTLNSRKIRKEDPSENLINSKTLSSAYTFRPKKTSVIFSKGKGYYRDAISRDKSEIVTLSNEISEFNKATLDNVSLSLSKNDFNFNESASTSHSQPDSRNNYVIKSYAKFFREENPIRETIIATNNVTVPDLVRVARKNEFNSNEKELEFTDAIFHNFTKVRPVSEKSLVTRPKNVVNSAETNNFSKSAFVPNANWSKYEPNSTNDIIVVSEHNYSEKIFNSNKNKLEFKENLISRTKATAPNNNITSDVIVADSIGISRKSDFDSIHIISSSPNNLMACPEYIVNSAERSNISGSSVIRNDSLSEYVPSPITDITIVSDNKNTREKECNSNEKKLKYKENYLSRNDGISHSFSDVRPDPEKSSTTRHESVVNSTERSNYYDGSVFVPNESVSKYMPSSINDITISSDNNISAEIEKSINQIRYPLNSTNDIIVVSEHNYSEKIFNSNKNKLKFKENLISRTKATAPSNTITTHRENVKNSTKSSDSVTITSDVIVADSIGISRKSDFDSIHVVSSSPNNLMACPEYIVNSAERSNISGSSVIRNDSLSEYVPSPITDITIVSDNKNTREKECNSNEKKLKYKENYLSRNDGISHSFSDVRPDPEKSSTTRHESVVNSTERSNYSDGSVFVPNESVSKYMPSSINDITISSDNNISAEIEKSINQIRYPLNSTNDIIVVSEHNYSEKIFNSNKNKLKFKENLISRTKATAPSNTITTHRENVKNSTKSSDSVTITSDVIVADSIGISRKSDFDSIHVVSSSPNNLMACPEYIVNSAERSNFSGSSVIRNESLSEYVPSPITDITIVSDNKNTREKERNSNEKKLKYKENYLSRNEGISHGLSDVRPHPENSSTTRHESVVNSTERSNYSDGSVFVPNESVSEYMPSSINDITIASDNNISAEIEKSINEIRSPLNITKVIVPHSSQSKKHFCIFCKTLQTKLARHFFLRHKSEKEIKTISNLPKKHIDRLKMLDKLRKDGDFLHNTSHSLNTGILIVSRQQNSKAKNNSDDYVCCRHCKGFFSKRSLKFHLRCCGKYQKHDRTNMIQSRRMTQYIHDEANEILKTKIFPVLRNDDITNAIRYDDLIIKYGNKMSQKYTLTHQHDMIRSQLRLLGRFKICVQEMCPAIKNLKEIFNPQMHDICIKAVHKVAKWDNTSMWFKTPAVAQSLTSLLKKCGYKQKTEYIKTQQDGLKKNVEDFLQLWEEEVPVLINKKACEDQANQKRIKKIVLPSKEDIKKLYMFLKSQIMTHIKALQVKFCSQSWTDLIKSTLIFIQIFNRRRAGEIERLTLSNYTNKEVITDNVEEALLKEISAASLQFAKQFVRIVIRGKLGRTVGVLLSPLCISAIDTIIKYRETAGIPTSNEYIFSKTTTSRLSKPYFRACPLLRQFSTACGAMLPESLRGTSLRKHIATYTSLLNVEEATVDKLANFMGHHKDIHKNIYRTSVPVTEITCVSKILTNAVGGDDGEMFGYMSDGGKELSNTCESADEESSDSAESSILEEHPKKRKRSTSPYGKTKRSRWSEEERGAVISHFGNLKDLEKLPSLVECMDAIQKLTVLKNRTPQQLKTWIDNQRRHK